MLRFPIIVKCLSSLVKNTTLEIKSLSLCRIYPNLPTDIEVIPTDLTEDNVFGWTLENNDQNEIEIHKIRKRIL